MGFRTLVVLSLFFLTNEGTGISRAAEPVRREWTVDSVTRQAFIVIPDKAATSPAPVVFGFHGHGGSMQNAARSFRIHHLWPEAIVVYMQGLNTPGQLTDPEGRKAGWQKQKGDQKDRDFKFFDAVLSSLKKDFLVDDKRVYSMGHSNGGSFTYLLWAERPDVFAALAPSGALSLQSRRTLKPKPMLHIAGDNDPLVKFAWQSMMIDSVKKLNQCAETGVSWEGVCTQYPSKIDAPVVTYITSGRHAFPKEAPALIVKFFQQHPGRSVSPASE